MFATQIRTCVVALALWTVTGPARPLPPEQPADGPGGRSYPHERVVWTRLGSGADAVHLFEPASPAPQRAPVIVFGHGWAGMDPNYYGAWITHIVRRGNIVIFPRYQADVRTPVREFTGHALRATMRALDHLHAPGHVTPDERGLAFVGHSMGGLVVSNLAAAAARGELPPPLTLMAVEPGKTWPNGSMIAFPLDDLSSLPPTLLLLTVVGEDDDFVREIEARKIYNGASAVAPDNKDYVRMRSDDHGAPELIADHRAPTAPADIVGAGPSSQALSPRLDGRGPMVVDALDYYGTWKLLDGLVDAAFRGVHRDYALGRTSQQRFMGRWSDGRPVRELIVMRP